MNDDRETVILVDDEDRQIGALGKIEAHRLGLRHRAISVCVTNGCGEMLLQRRALGKYHSGGLWTNTCCTHPRIGEEVGEAAARRLKEELGVDCGLHFLRVTHYRADVGSDLVEDEIVHMYHGRFDGEVRPDPEEVMDYAWLSRSRLVADVAKRPEAYTYWFRHYLEHHPDEIFQGVACS
ncbi:isopentenyl-diphosphate delta-isomerase [Rhodoblastus sphagnicola]|uniref:Isopentenyl-diphosphate Delta-isomerase n=1 Tax=Rhodoblastus sphagnicola TaxID=333368 RepID=A0A2S6NCE6_9HYPH|nr:isopentenyl-diphosphate Delta-isomerase [Rhodoblastus sphagnicola]MBB4196839.1 isopentenyl-diphosphate delta-isomerase [Rhodoblastus sphagnicola]PPQ32277.1 isopentenyl-diphosphate delta-isomerase [Rhodoblastus sphagnicola]